MGVGAPCAIGVVPDGTWIGFARTDAGDYLLAVGRGERNVTAPAPDDVLLALAIAYFEEALDDPPAELEATHADLADLVRRVAAGSAATTARLLAEAVDAIDDGLGGEVVATRLAAARSGTPNEQADPVDLLIRVASATEVP